MKKKENERLPEGLSPAITKEVPIFLVVFFAFFVLLGSRMGASNMFNTMMNTAHDLLINTVFYIMAIAVLAGAVSALWSEFGLIFLFNKILSPLIKPAYGLPGASAVGIFTTYLSDNPAILTLADDHNFRRFFKKYQLPALCNIGTSFGMGLIITTCMIGIPSPSGEGFGLAVLVGNLGAIVGSIVSTRLMLRQTANIYGKEADCEIPEDAGPVFDFHRYRRIRKGSVSSRVMDALLEGGKAGVDMGLSIIPGVLIICTMVMMLTNGMPEGGYTGAAYEGIGLLPWLGEKLHFLLMPLFGFSSAEAIAVPITALGSSGASIGIVENLVRSGLANAHDVAVFTAMCMCWSGYLSTHVAMMDSLKCHELTGKAILSHTVGGLCAGISANWLYTLLSMLL
jgi:spore maturation protein SpmB